MYSEPLSVWNPWIGKGIRLEVRFEHGEEKAFGDGLDAADVLVLCDLVDGVDVIHPLDTIEVALVNGVDA